MRRGRKARRSMPRGTYLCMEGPQFSTRAESRLYRSWGAHVIGMTNLQEAKLAREAEICFATLALATDYDCWNESAGDVEIEHVSGGAARTMWTWRSVRSGAPWRNCRRRAPAPVRSALKGCYHHRTGAHSQKTPRGVAADYREISMSVLVVGTVAFDSIETPFGSAERILGGSASYFALGASFFAPVRIVGVIGEDFPQDYIDLFTQRNIDIEGLQREKGDTFHWRGRYHEDINMRDTIELHLNVLAGFEPKLPERYRDAEYVFLGNIDPVMQMEVLDQMRRMKLVVCDTMDHWIRESQEELKKVLERIEMLVDQRFGSATSERL